MVEVEDFVVPEDLKKLSIKEEVRVAKSKSYSISTSSFVYQTWKIANIAFSFAASMIFAYSAAFMKTHS